MDSIGFGFRVPPTKQEITLFTRLVNLFKEPSVDEHVNGIITRIWNDFCQKKTTAAETKKALSPIFQNLENLNSNNQELVNRIMERLIRHS